MMKKKSKSLLLYGMGIMAVTYVLTSGEEDHPVEGLAFANPADCDQFSDFSAEDCTLAYEAAVEEHEFAPRFSDPDICFEEFGPGACEARVDEASGGSFWTPFLMGYIVSEVIDEVGDAMKRRTRPIYRHKSGRFFSRDGMVLHGVKGRRFAMDRGQFTRDFRPNQTVFNSRKQFSGFTKATSRQKSGGFGKSRSTRSSS